MGKIKKQVESGLTLNSQFEVPVLSPEGVCYKFICENDRYHASVQETVLDILSSAEIRKTIVERSFTI